jgi:hypothetical protein
MNSLLVLKRAPAFEGADILISSLSSFGPHCGYGRLGVDFPWHPAEFGPAAVRLVFAHAEHAAQELPLEGDQGLDPGYAARGGTGRRRAGRHSRRRRDVMVRGVRCRPPVFGWLQSCLACPYPFQIIGSVIFCPHMPAIGCPQSGHLPASSLYSTTSKPNRRINTLPHAGHSVLSCGCPATLPT